MMRGFRDFLLCSLVCLSVTEPATQFTILSICYAMCIFNRCDCLGFQSHRRAFQVVKKASTTPQKNKRFPLMERNFLAFR